MQLCCWIVLWLDKLANGTIHFIPVWLSFVTLTSTYCVCESKITYRRKISLPAFIGKILYRRIFCPVLMITEDMVTITVLAKIHSIEYFCNAKVAGLDEIFVQWKFLSIQFIIHCKLVWELHYNACIFIEKVRGEGLREGLGLCSTGVPL